MRNIRNIKMRIGVDLQTCQYIIKNALTPFLNTNIQLLSVFGSRIHVYSVTGLYNDYAIDVFTRGGAPSISPPPPLHSSLPLNRSYKDGPTDRLDHKVFTLTK